MPDSIGVKKVDREWKISKKLELETTESCWKEFPQGLKKMIWWSRISPKVCLKISDFPQSHKSWVCPTTLFSHSGYEYFRWSWPYITCWQMKNKKFIFTSLSTEGRTRSTRCSLLLDATSLLDATIRWCFDIFTGRAIKCLVLIGKKGVWVKGWIIIDFVIFIWSAHSTPHRPWPFQHTSFQIWQKHTGWLLRTH